MIKLHFQVIAHDAREYIIEYKNFSWEQHDEMMKYISYIATDKKIQGIKVTRWNDKGEKE